MKQNLDRVLGWSRSRAQSVILVAAYLCALIILGFCAYWFRFNLNNIDGISYMALAEQYANGQLDTALNAYWSPMVSWLMVPFLIAGLPATFAFMVVNGISAAVGIAVGSAFVWHRTGRRFVPTLLFLAIATLFYAGTSFILTPDSLVVTWVLLFLATLTWVDDIVDVADSGRRQLWLAGAVLGAMGALGYVIKQFLIPVFVVVVVIWLVIRFWPLRRAVESGRRRPVLETVTAAVVVATIICAPWALALSVKYGEPTIGTSFAVNMESKFAPPSGVATDAPVNLVTPPNGNAVSFGEDRSFQTAAARAAQAADAADSASDGTAQVEKSSLFTSAKYYVKQRIEAFPFYMRKIGMIAPFGVLTIAGVGIALAFGFVSYRAHRPVALAGIIAGVYFVGYAGITSAASGGGNSRYYWPVYILATMMALLLLPRIWERVRADGKKRKLVAVVLLFSLLPIATIWQHGLGKSAPFSSGSGSPGLRDRIASGNAKSAEQTFVELQLASVIPKGSKIVGSNYRTTVKFGYLLGAQVYGKSNSAYDPSDPAFLTALQENGVDYYVDFSPERVQRPVDTGRIGPVVARLAERFPCADIEGAVIEPCMIRVVEVTPAP
jgi:hypothetical protein